MKCAYITGDFPLTLFNSIIAEDVPSTSSLLGIKHSNTLCYFYLFLIINILLIIVVSAVKYQMNLHGKSLKPGDVLMTNSPYAGGSYVLPFSPTSLTTYLLPHTVISRISPSSAPYSTYIRIKSSSSPPRAGITPTSGGFYPGRCRLRRPTSSRRVRILSALRS